LDKFTKIGRIRDLIAGAKAELEKIESRKNLLLERINTLKATIRIIQTDTQEAITEEAPVSNSASQETKIHLYRSLFKGREDVFPKRFESANKEKTGYQPVCRHEWMKGICEKPKVKCRQCTNREFVPVSDKIVENHLRVMILRIDFAETTP